MHIAFPHTHLIAMQDYIHLNAVQTVWTSPTTPDPHLEPLFAAAMHAIELGTSPVLA